MIDESLIYEERRTLQWLEEQIMQNKTEKTYQLVGASPRFYDITTQKLQTMGVDTNQGINIVTQAMLKNALAIIGEYKISHYVGMFEQLRELEQTMLRQSVESRQLVISFPKLHCFQNIQFLFRDKEVFIIINMRSCNFRKNFLTDLFLGYYCGTILAVAWEQKYGFTFDTFNVIMNIGSLHIFKSEV
jgi:hypothetical protein